MKEKVNKMQISHQCRVQYKSICTLSLLYDRFNFMLHKHAMISFCECYIHISGPPERRVSSYLCRLVEFTRWGQKRNAKSTLCTLILHGNCAVYLCTCKYFCYKAPDWSSQVRKVHKYTSTSCSGGPLLYYDVCVTRFLS